MLQKTIIRLVITTAVPKLINALPVLFDKLPDLFTYKFTQYQYDFVIEAHAKFVVYNALHPENKYTLTDLVQSVNFIMKTSISKHSLSKIWNDEINRDSLDEGEPYFKY